MKTLSLFIEPRGTVATMKTNPNDDVNSYVVFVRQWTKDGPIQLAPLLPEELESPEGATVVMDEGLGYDFLLHAGVQPKSHAAISVQLEMGPPGEGAFDQPVALPSSEGSVVERKWKVVLR